MTDISASDRSELFHLIPTPDECLTVARAGVASRSRTTSRTPNAIGMTASTFIVVTGNPAISCSWELETGGFASPSHDGFALALWDEVNNIVKSVTNVWMSRQRDVATAKKQVVRSFPAGNAHPAPMLDWRGARSARNGPWRTLIQLCKITALWARYHFFRRGPGELTPRADFWRALIELKQGSD